MILDTFSVLTLHEETVENSLFYKATWPGYVRDLKWENLASSSILPITGSIARLAAVENAEPADHSVKSTNKLVSARHTMRSYKQE